MQWSESFVGFDEAGINQQPFFVWYFVVRGERNPVEREGRRHLLSVRSLPVLARAVRSGGAFRSPFLKSWQAIAEPYPREVVAKPRMMGRWKCFRMIEAARRDVDESDGIVVLVR